jgi:hypothetical protein
MKERNIDVKVITIGSDKRTEIEKYKNYIQEKGLNDCINTIDLFDSFKANFDGGVTPKIYLLDENKIIRSKSIGADQLESVLDMIISEEKNKKQ